MYNIKTYNKISNVGLDEFDKSAYTCGDDVENPVGAIVRSAALHDTEFPKTLLAIARAGRYCRIQHSRCKCKRC